MAPYRAVARHFRQAHPHESVLLTGDDDLADVNGDGHPCNWHSTTFYDQILDTGGLPGMVGLMRSHNVHYFLGQKRNPDPARSKALLQLLAFCTVREFELHDFYFARLSPECEQGDENAIQRLLVAHALPSGDRRISISA